MRKIYMIKIIKLFAHSANKYRTNNYAYKHMNNYAYVENILILSLLIHILCIYLRTTKSFNCVHA